MEQVYANKNQKWHRWLNNIINQLDSADTIGHYPQWQQNTYTFQVYKVQRDHILGQNQVSVNLKEFKS